MNLEKWEEKRLVVDVTSSQHQFDFYIKDRVRGFVKTQVPLCVCCIRESEALSCFLAPGCETLHQLYQRIALMSDPVSHTHTHTLSLHHYLSFALFCVCSVFVECSMEVTKVDYVNKFITKIKL